MRDARSLTLAMPRFTFGLGARLLVLTLVFIAEKILLDSFVDSARAQSATGVAAFVRLTQHWGFRFLVTFVAAVFVFAYVRGGQQLRSAEATFRDQRLKVGWVIAHLVGIVTLVFFSHSLYRAGATQWEFAAVLCGWLAIGVGTFLAALLAAASRSLWLAMARALGSIWLYALLTAFVSVLVWRESELLWEPTADITFALVRAVLSPILPGLQADATIRVLATNRFAVQISEICSGLEGMGMMLVFVIVWLFCFRRDYIFPRALILIPAGVFAMFLLNVVRISLLMLIGYAGFPDVASFGFHSQAGWIAFNSVACGLAVLSRRISWINRIPNVPGESGASRNPTATYLVPLLVLIVAGMVSHALSGRFESFYPLRLVFGLLVLWTYRKDLWALDWRWSWRALLTGAAVFVIWILAAHFFLPSATIPGPLASMTPAMFFVWVAARFGMSVLIVPIAEELAYRGYLMRCFGGVEFESLPYQAVGWVGLIVSATAFGLMHGAMWLPGLVAGLSYGFIVMRSGTLGEGVLAHATTNALIAATVIGFHQWQLW